METVSIQKNKLVFWTLFLFVGCFSWGYVAAPDAKIVTETVVEKQDDSLWRELKSVDDQGFDLASAGFGACSRMLEAAYNRDSVAMESGTKEVKEIVEELQTVVEKRFELMTQLGY